MSRQLTNTCCCGACLYGDLRTHLAIPQLYQNLRILIANPLSASAEVEYTDASTPRKMTWGVTLDQDLDIRKRNGWNERPPEPTYVSPSWRGPSEYWWWDQNITGPGITGYVTQNRRWAYNTSNQSFPWPADNNIPITTRVCIVLRPVGGRIRATGNNPSPYTSWSSPDFYFMGYSVPNCENLASTDRFSVDDIDDYADILGYGPTTSDLPLFCNGFLIDVPGGRFWHPTETRYGAGTGYTDLQRERYTVAGPHHPSPPIPSSYYFASGPLINIEWSTPEYSERTQSVMAYDPPNAPEVNDTTLGYVVEIWVQSFLDVPAWEAMFSLNARPPFNANRNPFVKESPTSKYAQIHQQLNMSCEYFPFDPALPPLEYAYTSCGYPYEALRLKAGYPLQDHNLSLPHYYDELSYPCRVKCNMFSNTPNTPNLGNYGSPGYLVTSGIGLFARYFKRCCDFSQGPVGTYYRCELPSKLRYDTQYSISAHWYGPGPEYSIDLPLYDFPYAANNVNYQQVGTYKFTRNFPNTIQVIDTTGTPP